MSRQKVKMVRKIKGKPLQKRKTKGLERETLCCKSGSLFYYKLRQTLLQIRAAIKNQGRFYCKLGQLLQIRAKQQFTIDTNQFTENLQNDFTGLAWLRM